VKLPRDLSGRALAKALECDGYHVVRQTGSHLRLIRTPGGQHLIIPGHSELKIGLLSAILGEVAAQVGRPKDEVVQRLFVS
jgi:predicted RNA binding protein YcfA (HicA-like mRNA interferase family)